jgi:hypothetical protein
MRHFSLLEFVAFLPVLKLEIEHANHHSLEQGAKLVEKQAKDYIGTYDVTPRWAELADSTKKDRVRKGFSANEPLLRTGELRDSISHTVTAHMAEIGSNNKKAVIHENGSSRAPPRPFLQPALDVQMPHILHLIGLNAQAALSGKKVS